ncbi:helix-turn-helix domain-containing protein [Streptomyces noursei]|uniref:helix-turn-helix domain-containing protein n=1 Tax=Streptomyces noursei TaxID=1971 RepID=UPI001676F982|nr:helix-turn-helix transcriptional regulator [Streptomyces noursei]MCZ1021231.1 helix-turn-helix transcriptional regulator [Streptomyces noursei]
MTPRQFDRKYARQTRRAKDLTLADVAKRLGHSGNWQVSAWEQGKKPVPSEKLAAYANALGVPLDRLAPRQGEPDLRDLRHDRGISLKEIPAIIQAKSDGPVKNAERGVRPLADEYAVRLAEKYEVSLEQLRAAEARSSSGHVAPVATPTSAVESPRTLAEKITYLVRAKFPDAPPTDHALAQAINAKAGLDIVSTEQVQALRTGDQPPAAILGAVPETTLYDALGAYFDCSPLYFRGKEEQVLQTMEGLRLLANLDDLSPEDVVLQARGGEGGFSRPLLAALNAALEKLKGDSRGNQGH